MAKRWLALVSYLVPLTLVTLATNPVCFAQTPGDSPEKKPVAEQNSSAWKTQAAAIEKLLNAKYDGTVNTSSKPVRLYLCLLPEGVVQWQYIWNTCGVAEIDEAVKQSASAVEQYPTYKTQWWALAVLPVQSKSIQVVEVPKIDWKTFMSDLQKEIKSNWHPPEEKHTEAALARFKINEKAEIADFRFEKPTNDPEFDKAAKAALDKLKPRPFPPDAPDQADIEFSFTYNPRLSNVQSPPIVVPTSDSLIAQAIKFDHGKENPAVQSMKLNNEATTEIIHKQFESAITKLQTAILADPRYKLAQNNLAIAYTNYGLEESYDYLKALSYFHRACFYGHSSKVHLANISAMVIMLKKSPMSFDDRKGLAIDAETSGDLIGALVEYSAAIGIKPDGDVYIRRGDIYAKLGSKDLALAQYQLAKKAGDERADEKIAKAAPAKP